MLLALCVTGSETEITDHYFLRCPFFPTKRQKLLNDLLKTDPFLRNLKDDSLLDIILYGSDKYKDTVNKEIFFTQLILLKMPSASKDHFLTTSLLLLLLY